MLIDITQGTWATSYGSGPFHPAIRNGCDVWYWPNITYGSEDAATKRAAEALQDAQAALDAVSSEWNMVR